MAPEGTFVDMPLALGVFLSVLGARLIASRINIIVQSLRRYIMLEKGIVERAERVRGEIGRGKRKLKELSIVDNFVLYSKTQRRIAKLEKELSQLDAKISVTKVSFPLSAVLRGIPMVLVAIVVRYLYFSKPIAAFIPLQRAPIIASIIPILWFLRSGILGVGVWMLVCNVVLSEVLGGIT
ncbi:hypothetical protein AAMO2058_001016500 [Amorphochlora amoebiformis]